MSKGLVNSTGWLVVFFLSCSQGVTPREELVSAREEALLKTPESATTRFDRWLARYLAADAATRVALEAQGAQLAEQRKSEFIELIHASPRQAFDSAVQPQVRAQLPASVNRWVERFGVLERNRGIRERQFCGLEHGHLGGHLVRYRNLEGVTGRSLPKRLDVIEQQDA